MTSGYDPKSRAVEVIGLFEKALQQKIQLGEGDLLVQPLLTVEPPSVAAVPRFGSLEEFCQAISGCTKCPLHKGRTKFVFGAGNPQAEIMFIGEGPGREEDLKGEPFVGRAGQLLDRILAAIKFDRTQVYIANVVKCRPPGNREPEPAEMAECLPYLLQQIEMINPQFICCLGRISAQALLDTKLPLGKLRGYFHQWQGRRVLVTYHPAALLRFPQYKHETWEDVKLLRAAYDEYISSKQF